MAHILAVVNDLFFAERLEIALSRLGHTGRVVDLSQEATVELSANTDLVLADLEAPDEAYRVIERAQAVGTPVLAFGPHTDLAMRERGLAAGATKVVAKSKITTSMGELISDLLREAGQS